MAYHKQAELPEARRYLEAAVKADPGNLVAARFLADVYGREERWREARDLYQRVVAREPGNAWAAYGVGRALIGLGEYEAALAPLRSALVADPALAEAHFQLGQALRQLGRRPESERELALFKALRDRAAGADGPLRSQRTPFEARVWKTCAALLAENREGEALAYLDSLPGARPERSPYLLGVLAFNLGRSGDAVRLLKKAVALAPEDADALASLGRASRGGRRATSRPTASWPGRGRALPVASWPCSAAASSRTPRTAGKRPSATSSSRARPRCRRSSSSAAPTSTRATGPRPTRRPLSSAPSPSSDAAVLRELEAVLGAEDARTASP